MNVLVTGGAGYIGSHTAKALARSDYRPIVIDDLIPGMPITSNGGRSFVRVFRIQQPFAGFYRNTESRQ